MTLEKTTLGMIALMASLSLSACGNAPSTGFNQTRSNGAKVIVDGTPINWGVTNNLKHSSGADGAMFLFFGPDLENVTMESGLSLAQRQELARKAVEMHPTCEWVGFDPAFHKALEGNTGRPKSELWVPVTC